MSVLSLLVCFAGANIRSNNDKVNSRLISQKKQQKEKEKENKESMKFKTKINPQSAHIFNSSDFRLHCIIDIEREMVKRKNVCR